MDYITEVFSDIHELYNRGIPRHISLLLTNSLPSLGTSEKLEMSAEEEERQKSIVLLFLTLHKNAASALKHG